MPVHKDLNQLTVGIAQISPVWLNRAKTLDKMADYLKLAADKDCQLVVFGEALLPGYPYWIELTNGAKFNSPVQKEIHAHYLQNAIQIEAGHINGLCEAAGRHRIAVALGCIERALDRGAHSIYAALVYISPNGVIRSVHRKLMPTYEERLTWSPGDGHGLRVHPLGPFTVGGLNCWENWMPLARAALYGQGEDLHIAVWPGGIHNTRDITRFIAMEARSYVVSASGLMRKTDFPQETPHLKAILADCPDMLANGGSCIAGPDGEWIVAPVVGEEKLIVATLDFQSILKERQNFDPAGHYARPDVTQLTVNRQRQSTLKIVEGNGGRFCSVVNCMDGRVQLPVIRYLQKRFNVDFVDSINEAGPNLILSENKNAGLMQSILDRLKISVMNHNSVGIAICGHHDCAGNPSPQDGQIIHIKKAAALLRRHYKEIDIIGLWVDKNWVVREVA